jgi:signal transduction histidine kinase
MDTMNEYDEEVTFLSRKLLDLNKQLIESEKAKSRFLSLVANELNDPMTALLGLIPRMKPQNGDPFEGIFGMIHQEALLLDFRIQNLVAAAQIESGEIDTTYASVRPEAIVKEAIEDLKYLIQRNNILISIHDTLMRPVVSDPRKLYLIVKNLIANGCTYGLTNSMVDISITESASTLIIEVNNQGDGPIVEFKPQVFTRFAEGLEGEHGLGIGLSIVRGLCESLEGNVDYTIDKSWVTFTVTLPLETTLPDSDACGSNEFLFESFDDAVEF